MPRRLLDQNPRREARRQGLILDRLEVGFRNRIMAELIRAMEEMVRVFELTGEVPPARNHYEQLEAAYRAMAISAATTFGARVMQQGKDAGYILETKGFAETMARLALDYIGQEVIRRRITSVAETTRAQIVAAVARGYADGLGQQGVGAYVRGVVSDMATWRANLIARTETHGAANFGATAAAKETGLPLQKEWISAEDARTRPDHDAANGQIVGRDEPFRVGGEALDYPGDPSGSAENTINCFHPSSLIATAGLKGGIRRDYIGQMVKISCGGPVNLTVTPNHPILTKRGWVPAGRIVKGDDLIYSRFADFREICSSAKVNDRYSFAHQLYDTGKRLGFVGGPGGVVMDFHGEMVAEQVNVVSFNGGLRDRFKALGEQLFGQLHLTSADVIPGDFLARSMVALGRFMATDAPDSIMGSGGSGGPSSFALHGGGAPVAFGHVQSGQAQFVKNSSDHASRDANGFCDAVGAVTSAEHLSNLVMVGAPDDSPSFGNGAFEFLKCASVEVFHYDGPVYNFESDTGLLLCSGIVNHNCRCAVGWIVQDD